MGRARMGIVFALLSVEVGSAIGSGDADGGANFHGQQRKNDTHASTTHPDSRLYRKAAGREAKLWPFCSRSRFFVKMAGPTPDRREKALRTSDTGDCNPIAPSRTP